MLGTMTCLHVSNPSRWQRHLWPFSPPRLFSDSHVPYLKVAVLRALGALRDVDHIDLVASKLDDEDRMVQAAALLALGAFGILAEKHYEAVAAKLEFMEFDYTINGITDDSLLVQRAAIQALSGFGNFVKDVHIAALKLRLYERYRTSEIKGASVCIRVEHQNAATAEIRVALEEPAHECHTNSSDSKKGAPRRRRGRRSKVRFELRVTPAMGIHKSALGASVNRVLVAVRSLHHRTVCVRIPALLH
mmetsp:Transcript_4756/g.11996  ORF Transcript_4756/g.11996 Transcript_4756/m.11996 type:complete len:247 (-) Transcript_4756:1681-2421(-)